MLGPKSGVGHREGGRDSEDIFHNFFGAVCGEGRREGGGMWQIWGK